MKKLIISLMLFISTEAHAETYCARPSATGLANGSNWNDAIALSSVIASDSYRGDTVYISGESYGSLSFTSTVAGSDYITIKKATATDHATSIGWESAWEAPATFSSWVFSSSYWHIDGQVGGGPTAWTSGHGFDVEFSGNIACAASPVVVGLLGAVSNISIEHTEIHATNNNYPISGITGTTGAVDNFTVSNCYIHTLFRPAFYGINWTNILIEKTLIKDVRSTGPADPLGYCNDTHSEGMTVRGTNSNITIRHSVWDNIEGTAVIAGVNDGSLEGLKFYGNIVSKSTTPIYYYYQEGDDEQILNNLLYLNNTVVDSLNSSIGSIAVQRGSGNVEYNTVYYNNTANVFYRSNVSHDYSFALGNIRIAVGEKDSEIVSGESSGFIGSSSPFVFYIEDNFISSDYTPPIGFYAENEGYDTSAILPENSVDMFGNARGANGYWERGAIANAPYYPGSLGSIILGQ